MQISPGGPERYTLQYDPEAYVLETASSDVKEEFKRKIRISSGGIQPVNRERAKRGK